MPEPELEEEVEDDDETYVKNFVEFIKAYTQESEEEKPIEGVADEVTRHLARLRQNRMNAILKTWSIL